MIIKHLKALFFSVTFMLTNHSTLQAMIQEVPACNEDNIVVAATLEKILERAAALLSDEENDKIREMISALVYSNNPLVSEEEYQRINANYLGILKSEKFAKYYLACFRLYLDEDDNFRIEVEKTSEEHVKSFREFQLYLNTRLYPCLAVAILEFVYAINLREALEKGEDSNEIIAKMIKLPISYYLLFQPRDIIDRMTGALGLWTLIPKEHLVFNFEAFKTVGNMYYQVFQNLANICYEYYYGEA